MAVVAFVVASIIMARPMVGWGVRVVVAPVMMRLVVIVIIIPNMNPVAAVLVAPLNFGLEMRSLSVFVSLDSMIRVTAPVTKLPGSRIWNARVSVCWLNR